MIHFLHTFIVFFMQNTKIFKSRRTKVIANVKPLSAYLSFPRLFAIRLYTILLRPTVYIYEYIYAT